MAQVLPQRTAARSRLAADPTLAAVAALTVLAAAIRLATLGQQSLWLDESVTVDLVRRSFGGMLATIPHSESTPPLYYALAWVWSRVFGSGAVGLRSLSAVLGIALVPAVYLAASRLVSRRAGVAAAALAACNPLLVWYSQEARSYALLTLLCALSLAAFARVRERRAGLAAWALWSALALATHYFAVFVVAPVLVWIALDARPRRWRAWVPCAAVVAVGLTLLPLAIRQSENHSADYIVKTSLVRRLAQVPKQDLVGYQFPHQAAVAAVALALALAALALLARAGPRERAGAAVAASIGGAAVAAPAVLALAGVDYLIARNVIGSWPAFATVVAAGLGGRRSGRAGVTVTALLCATGLVAVALLDTHAAYRRDDWRGVARALGPARVDRALVVQPLNGRFPLAVYRPDVRTLARATVREIDVVAIVERGSSGVPRPPRPAAIAVPAGFRVAERRFADTYTLIRFVAPAPVAVTPASPLASLRVEPGIADYLLERPAAKPPDAPGRGH